LHGLCIWTQPLDQTVITRPESLPRKPHHWTHVCRGLAFVSGRESSLGKILLAVLLVCLVQHMWLPSRMDCVQHQADWYRGLGQNSKMRQNLWGQSLQSSRADSKLVARSLPRACRKEKPVRPFVRSVFYRRNLKTAVLNKPSTASRPAAWNEPEGPVRRVAYWVLQTRKALVMPPYERLRKLSQGCRIRSRARGFESAL